MRSDVEFKFYTWFITTRLFKGPFHSQLIVSKFMVVIAISDERNILIIEDERKLYSTKKTLY